MTGKSFFLTIYLAINKCSMYNNTIFNEHTTKKFSLTRSRTVLQTDGTGSYLERDYWNNINFTVLLTDANDTITLIFRKIRTRKKKGSINRLSCGTVDHRLQNAYWKKLYGSANGVKTWVKKVRLICNNNSRSWKILDFFVFLLTFSQFWFWRRKQI